jgi:2-polyprenyl-3-methyl-5-hydroxy-6-metoxy-1,4-benzoquinol methylase
MMESVVCNLCGFDQGVPERNLTDLLLGNKDVVTQLVKCSSCGLIYQNPRPLLQDMGKYYPPEYESYIEIPPDKLTRLQKMSIDYGIKKRAGFVLNYKSGGTILDIGCASGRFLAYFKLQPSWQPFGVEISETAGNIAKTQYGLDVTIGALEDARFPENFFDVITMWDVLEHLGDPSGTLAEIHRILKPDGILVLRVPNSESDDAHLFKQYWAGLDAPRHFYVFSPTTLKYLLAKNHFEIVASTTHSGAYPTFILSFRFFLRAKGLGEKLKWLVGILSSSPVKLITAPLFFLRSSALKGPELITIVRNAKANL